MSQCLNPECLEVNPDKTQFCKKCGTKLLLVDRYRAVKILGKGGFGRNCLITHRGLEGLNSSTAKNVLPKPPLPKILTAR